MKFKEILAISAMVLGLAAGSASATVIDMLGTKEFNDGDGPIFVEFTANANGDPAPFNQFIGNDLNSGSVADISFTHNIGPVPGATSASIELGIYDHDSFSATDDTLDIFFDGVLQDTSAWLGISSSPATHHIRSMVVDVALLIDGLLDVRIVSSVPAGLSGNGIGVDYSKLTVEGAIPLPASGILLLSAFGLIALRRKKS